MRVAEKIELDASTERELRVLSRRRRVAEPPLPDFDQATLYSAALNDVDAFTLSSTLGLPLRLDPPIRSYSSVSPSSVAKTVVLPMVSYSTGAAAGYLYFGTATFTDSASAPHTLPIRFMVCNDGAVRISLNQTVQICPDAQLAELMFASYFPDAYKASLDQAYTLPTGAAPAGGSAALNQASPGSGDGGSPGTPPPGPEVLRRSVVKLPSGHRVRVRVGRNCIGSMCDVPRRMCARYVGSRLLGSRRPVCRGRHLLHPAAFLR